ncbi:MAG: hypothetical protein K2Y37_17490 [Pirellulales bacterium]|nr:hypothetical protein [Pirellulales bacterium]
MAAIFWYASVSDIRAGISTATFGPICRRAERPALFWIITTTKLLAALLTTVAAMATLVFAVFGLPA